VKNYSNARWYDADTARFVSEDPARDGVNWFAYVYNNPIGYIDPSGLYGTNAGYSGYDPGTGSTADNGWDYDDGNYRNDANGNFPTSLTEEELNQLLEKYGPDVNLSEPVNILGNIFGEAYPLIITNKVWKIISLLSLVIRFLNSGMIWILEI
jgi:hypothetical protein